MSTYADTLRRAAEQEHERERRIAGHPVLADLAAREEGIHAAITWLLDDPERQEVVSRLRMAEIREMAEAYGDHAPGWWRGQREAYRVWLEADE